ncbi:general substrate transporter [Stipitochalara longipes BDJ]|nr:general substrate transporter [Stipitochalara longipes BDJ]
MVVGNIYIIAAVAVLGENAYKCYFNQGPEGPLFNDNLNCSGPRSLVQGGITASMAGGSWLGALISGISDRLGRKTSIMTGCVICVIGSILVCASQNIGMLIVGRIINGLAVGIESAQVPVYVSELTPPSKRGRFVGAQQWAITWGIMIMFYVSYGCSFIGGQHSNDYSTAAFRVPWGIKIIPAMGLFFAMIFLPESPGWLARKDRWEECHSVLTLVHGKGDPHSPFVTLELEDIKNMCEFERLHKDVTYLNLFKPNMLNRTIIAVFMQISSQLTGMNVMSNANLLASSIQYVINVVMTIPALIYVDRWGRRPTLLIGAALMGTWMFANAGILGGQGVVVPGGVDGVAEESMQLTGTAAKGLIACMYLFVASYAPTWGPQLPQTGHSISLSGLFTPPAFVNIKWKVYLIFGIFNLAMFIHVFFMFPETAGKTLEETENMFEDPNGPKYIGTLAWKTRVDRRAVMLERGQADVEGKAAVRYVEDDKKTVTGDAHLASESDATTPPV